MKLTFIFSADQNASPDCLPISFEYIYFQDNLILK